jgi:phosphoribosylformimino-5-aminoimidazole carboxamide ribotide isomerase
MIEIIPAIDIIEGKCVRLKQGDYASRKIYNGNPLEVAKSFEDAGLKRLHLVDLEGAKANQVVNIKILEQIASGTKLVIDFGGGIKTDEELERVFQSGASFATIGSIAIREPAMFQSWIDKYGNDKIILGADAKGDKLAITGWTSITEVNLYDYVENISEYGIKYVLCTDISKDGMLMGTSMDLYRTLKERFPDLNIIASGGVTKMDEVEQLNELNIYGLIIGKAIYEGLISPEDLSRFIRG